MDDLIDIFDKVADCEYKGEHYSARDNGAVMRHPKTPNRPRPLDNKWTFGKQDEASGYMLLGNERVHRIVCTAFFGKPQGDRNIVDHIDTNRQNNRADNLRWVSRLENVLNNPITRAKIELICGSIADFIANPALLHGHESENSNFSWMRNVSPEEAKVSYERWMEWANRPIEDRKSNSNGPGEWIYQTEPKNILRVPAHQWMDQTDTPSQFDLKNGQARVTHLPDSSYITYQCRQYKCPQECTFVHCPFTIPKNEDALNHYISSLKKGDDFLFTRYYKTVIEDFHYFEKDSKVRVLTKRIKRASDNTENRMPWQIFEITKDGTDFIHEHVCTYGSAQFDKCQIALKTLGIYKREEWKFKKSDENTRTDNAPIQRPAINNELFADLFHKQVNAEPEKVFCTAPNIRQINWKTPTEFPMCPVESTDNGLEQYYNNMSNGEIYCRNRYGESTLIDYAYNEAKNAIIVITHTPNPIKEWGLNKIFYKDGIFYHESLHMYFHEDGARKYFTIARGLRWTGGDVFDDYC